MNKKMREIYAKIENLSERANQYLDEGKTTEAEEIVNQINELERQYVVAEKLQNNKTAEITDEEIDKSIKDKKASGFAVIAKMLKGQKLNDVENAIIIESDNAENPNGTNYLIPEDVNVAIRELKRTYKSAKELVNVIPVTTLSGSTNFETEDDGLLDDFEDGQPVGESNNPKFVKKPWAIKFKGKLIYISNIVLGNEKAQLMSYINKWFIRKAVRTENKDIFAALKKEKTAVAVKGLDALKKQINLLDPSLKQVIVTNTSGFAAMDEEKDLAGRGMLSVDPTNASRKMFQSLPIEVFADNELPNIATGKYPIFIGSTKDGVDFMDRESLDFATSEHFAFNKNQTTLRVMEGYDVVETDKDAYKYLSYEEANEKVLKVEQTGTVKVEKEATEETA